MSLDIAMAQAALGRKVFPVDGKKPLVRWTIEATTNVRRLRAWWKVYPDANVGWAIPKGLGIIDIDDPETFFSYGLKLHESLGQETMRGYHVLYAYEEGREIKQGPIPGGDMKTGGKGYVKLYSADAFTRSIRFIHDEEDR